MTNSAALGGEHSNVPGGVGLSGCGAKPLINVPVGRTMLDTDEWQSYCGSHPAHATVRHGVHEWARDDDGDGRREVHYNTCEGAGAALRTYLRAFRGVHKPYLHLYVATYEAMLNAKRVTPHLIQRMCIGDLEVHIAYTRHSARSRENLRNFGSSVESPPERRTLCDQPTGAKSWIIWDSLPRCLTSSVLAVSLTKRPNKIRQCGSLRRGRQ